MKKKCFFHLGFHKTGSTYLQFAIDLNREGALQRFHIVNRASQETRPLKIALFRYGQKRNKDTHANALAECRQIIEQFEASGKTDLLLSDEALIGPMLRQSREKGLYSALESRFSCLIEGFSDYELHFLLYTRQAPHWLQSLYGQAVRQVRFSGDFAAFCDGVDISNIWGQLYRRMSSVVGKHQIRFFSMEQDANESFGIGKSLFDYVGVSEEERHKMAKPANPMNERWPDHFLQLMIKLNASQLDDASLDIVRALLREMVDHEAERLARLKASRSAMESTGALEAESVP